MIQRRQREIRRFFAESFSCGLDKIRLLELGCGSGQWLAEFASFGFRFENFAGIDLSLERTETAKGRIPGADIRLGDAAVLPWPDNSFDIVFQSTVFTSIKDPEKQMKIASEMKRVCRQDGFILWYDFIYDSPSNPNVQGVSIKKVKGLFHPWNCEFRSVTLAPPIARRLVPFSWSLAELLETYCPLLRTHVISKISR